MIDVNEVISYIEKSQNIKLLDYQKEILKHIIAGETIYTSRMVGRSIIYNGYAGYLKNIESQKQHDNKADYCVGYKDIIKEVSIVDRMKKIISLEEMEFESKFSGKSIDYMCFDEISSAE